MRRDFSRIFEIAVEFEKILERVILKVRLYSAAEPLKLGIVEFCRCRSVFLLEMLLNIMSPQNARKLVDYICRSNGVFIDALTEDLQKLVLQDYA
jgi:hypothetical protein